MSEQQASSEATSDAQLKETLAERVRTTSTARQQATSTARSAATARAQQTSAFKATLTAVAQATTGAQLAATEGYVSTLEARSEIVYGPVDGNLIHDADDSLVKTEDTELDLRDFIIEVRFYNPFDPSEGDWDYGFVLRREEKNTEIRFILLSSGIWRLLNTVGDPDGEIIVEEELPNLNLSEGESNLVKLIFQGDRGIFYLNGDLVKEFDLSIRMNSGAIYIGTGFYTGNEITGKSTGYRDFAVWSIP